MIAAQIEEFEETLQGILEFQREQEAAARLKEDAAARRKHQASLASSALQKHAAKLEWGRREDDLT